ncbi:uncharacterized protein KD926_010906 [Aspergillus affinis]|uniref:uncharacterized protein n=1 Tax=Aspergillus affinis TaxID=1070780 RepID=UPI0022FDEDC0|nr:uncharacterized protein KD926_010906 [Aspergillus affinis]KAI9038370.1 hypothetical protein KD926_010906 [Aspergillus affinis]
MFRHWTSIFSLILLFSIFAFVDAGHPLWEFSTKIKRAIPIDLNWPSITTWPGGTVTFCWEDEATRQQLGYRLRHAMNLWYMAGLPGNFRFQEVAHEDCMRDRRNSLVIHKAPGSIEYITTVGKYVGPVDAINPGPYVYFNDEDEPSSNNAARNTIAEKIAHEIGHIFGLYHEHQNPYFWRVRSLFTLGCENIEGYDWTTAHLTQEEIWGENGVCVNYNAALEHDWATAAHFLPRPELAYIPHPDRESVNEDVDWDSIMLYHSNVASKRGAPRGYYPTLKRSRNGIGYKIRLKRAPSQKDVQGLIRLYDASEQRPLPRLYHDPRSEYHTAFQNLQNFQACDWPPQAGPAGG